ncbi:MAG: hypothetical protein AMJ60_07875 [Desulfobacterales bacterium SG8_35]|nr:MAG: hypothetical protein AMJ60_07875 [Desulfobacterales bacterium SG8_35]
MPGKNTEKKAVITEMEEVENKILPNQNSRTFTFRKNRDGNGLHITLRYGRPGINYAVQYFTLNSPSLCGSNHHH